ncbi:hypothetical protein [Seonamhaeicola sp.]|uniref:hypothetical protein n=1 Tax=Seonamhaeicola sp. TaxID=1912245 RepID=UPI00260E7997|nr:hypothetical protein [Seonamhaeicola sp.]
MKTFKLIRYLMVVALSITLANCTSEYTPIPGQDGVDGVDGIDGIDGEDAATVACIECHSNTYRAPINSSYDFSGHQNGFAWTFASVRGGDDPTNRCAQCHGEQGYLDYITLGESHIDGYANASPISCTTCHDKHSSFDFENDGHDFALRTFDPVTLVIDGTTTLDFGGTSNNCITCHQPRSSYDIPGSTGDYEITSKRFGPHHGPQSTMLEGIMGAHISGTEAYPGVASSTHRTGASCVSCHMGPSEDHSQGLHSWVPTENACTSCHQNGVPTEIEGWSTDMARLEALLAANNMFDVDGYYVPGVYSAELAQAAWNYRTLLEDNSRGIHNPAYTRALLKNSIEALEN